MLTIAVRAARRAGEVITRSLERVDTLSVDAKGPADFVTEVDRRAERAIMEIIHRSYPQHGFLAEESGSHGGDDFLWIIDPLDGTTNFLHGFPVFSVSIALAVRGRLEVGVVYDPMRQELFTAVNGRGAALDDRRIRVSRRQHLRDALLGTGFPYRDMEHLDDFLGMFRALLPRTAGIRRPGSAALDLAYVACGRLDGFWEIGLKPWDMAAGALLVQEAGGLVQDFSGGGDYLETGDVVASNSRLGRPLLDILTEARGGA
jgi:myo-inositol-1(or 4)-monophosphatase